MSYVFCGFVLGFIIPYMARRFAKFMPASAAESVWRLIYSGKRANRQKRFANIKYKHLLSTYFWRCFMCGLLMAGMFFYASCHFAERGLWGVLTFIWALVLLLEIDYKTMFLPDVVTVPLLIGGFVFSSLYGEWVFPAESALGAAIGYVLPIVAALCIVWKHPDAFGGGDIKLLAAIGAWIGVLPIICTILTATVLFALFAFVMRRRVGAFGPAIAIAGIMVAFYFF